MIEHDFDVTDFKDSLRLTKVVVVGEVLFQFLTNHDALVTFKVVPQIVQSVNPLSWCLVISARLSGFRQRSDYIFFLPRENPALSFRYGLSTPYLIDDTLARNQSYQLTDTIFCCIHLQPKT